MEVLMGGDAVVEAEIGEGQRNVVLDVEGTVGVVDADARQPQSPAFVAHVQAVFRVVDGIQSHHAFVDVGAGVVHGVVVEPEEALLLPVVAAGGPVQVQVVHEHPGPVAAVPGPCHHRIMRVSVALGCGVGVVQVRQEGEIRGSEVLPVQLQRVLVQVVFEPDQDGFAVLGVDPGSREPSVEAVDGARRQRPLRAGGVGLAGCVERDRRPPVLVDGQDLGRCEGVGPHQQADLVDDRVREADLAGPDLVPFVAQ
jgi:hypothetical protein